MSLEIECLTVRLISLAIQALSVCASIGTTALLWHQIASRAIIPVRYATVEPALIACSAMRLLYELLTLLQHLAFAIMVFMIILSISFANHAILPVPFVPLDFPTHAPLAVRFTIFWLLERPVTQVVHLIIIIFRAILPVCPALSTVKCAWMEVTAASVNLENTFISKFA